MVPYGPVGSPMVPYGPEWSHMVRYGPVWSCMVPYGPIWSHMVPYGPVWFSLVLPVCLSVSNLSGDAVLRREASYDVVSLLLMAPLDPNFWRGSFLYDKY